MQRVGSWEEARGLVPLVLGCQMGREKWVLVGWGGKRLLLEVSSGVVTGSSGGVLCGHGV